jgi:hypothetical protein
MSLKVKDGLHSSIVYIMIVVVVMMLYMFVKTYQRNDHLKLIYVSAYNLYFNEK